METRVSEFIAPNSRRAIDIAKTQGLDVVLPEANQLQIDIDDEAALKVYEAHYDIVDSYWGIEHTKVTPSKSGLPGKSHITVTLSQKISNKDRIALQTFLGSDRKREILSYIQEENGDAHPTLFLEKKREKQTEEPAGRKFREEADAVVYG